MAAAAAGGVLAYDVRSYALCVGGEAAMDRWHCKYCVSIGPAAAQLYGASSFLVFVGSELYRACMRNSHVQTRASPLQKALTYLNLWRNCTLSDARFIHLSF